MSFIMRPIRFASTGHIIEGSGLFDGSSGYLSRTPSSAGNRQTFILDIICKRSKLGADERIFEAQVDGNNFIYGYWRSDNTLEFSQYTDPGYDFRYNTNQVFRDVASYMNLRFEVDTTAGTGERVKIFLNGTRITSFATATEPSVNFSTDWNTTNPHYIGYSSAGSGQYFTGYASRFVHLDGQTSGSMAEVTDDGFWQINDASELTFGNNGFLLTGGSAISAGTDSSSNASTTAVDVTSAASIWDGSTGSFNLANDDIICTGGDKAIFTKTVFTGVVDLEFTGVGEWSQALFGFSKYTTVNNAGTAAGGVDGVEGISIYEHASNATKFSDWSNTNAGNGNSPTATITRGQIAGETCNLIRQANGTVIFKIGGSTVFTGSDTYTGPIRVWMGSHGDITPPLSMTTVSITASGTAGNIFTPTGTITATNDSPTNGGDDDEYGNYATMNPLNPSAATLAEGNNYLTGGSNSTNGTLLIPYGQLTYFEAVRVGQADNQIGISVYGDTGRRAWRDNNTSSPSWLTSGGTAGDGTAEVLANGDVLGVAIDRVNDAIYFAKNNTWMNSGNPTSGSDKTGAIWTDLGLHEQWSPFAGSNANNVNVRFNFGATAFAYTPPTGYLPLATQNLPTPDVINYEDEYYIEAGISHSNGSTTAVTLPTSVSGGAMAIIRRTDAGGEWYVVDTVRGNNKFYTWSTAGAEDTATFSDQTLSGTSLVLPSALATGTYTIKVYYVGAYFQIKAWTGTTAAQTLTWDTALDSFGYMTSRARDDGSLTGVLFHKELDTGKVLLDADTTAQTTTGAYSQDPDKTDFRVVADASSTLLNTNGKLYISYGWADSGPYKSGVYTGNGNADGPVVNVGGKPAAFIEKSHNHGGSYYQFDIAHNTGNLADQTAFMEDPTQALTTNANTFDILSTGFKSRSADAGGNTSARPYLYWAEGIQPLTDGAINQGRAK